MALIHGGQLHRVAEEFHIPIEQWLDLSTGIAPYVYPICVIPEDIWHDLPQTNQPLLTSAQHYYSSQKLLAISGSQAVISRLPELWRNKCPESQQVYLPTVGYKEHEHAWVNAGFDLQYYKQQSSLQDLIQSQLAPYSVVVLINPNNPSGELFTQAEVEKILIEVKQQKGLLVVDEAFMDVIEPNQSVASLIDDDSLIVLRSVGKFFGLAGIRLGFLLASNAWLADFEKLFGPWQVNGPAQYLATQALADQTWQHQQRQRLAKQARQLKAILQACFGPRVTGTSLFQTVQLTNAGEVYQNLCQQGIYVRLSDKQDALRFGLPTEEQMGRLVVALAKVSGL